MNNLLRNFVKKNDFNRSSTHKDLKNDYDRNQEQEVIKNEVDEYMEEDNQEDYSDDKYDLLKDCHSICIKEYERSNGWSSISYN